MSLYNMIAGVNDLSEVALVLINLPPDNIPRFRDAGFVKDLATHELRIRVLTRTGGGNRNYYESEESCREHYPEYFDGSLADEGDTEVPDGPWNVDLYNNPYYLSNTDNWYDPTYAEFFFKIPEDHLAEVTTLVEKHGEMPNLQEAFEKALKELKSKG